MTKSRNAVKRWLAWTTSVEGCCGHRLRSRTDLHVRIRCRIGGRGVRWRALPAGLDPAVAELVVQLRKSKDRSGLSLQNLAAATGYSVSSWERYLGGRSLPPREAVQALAAAAGTAPADAERLLALHGAAADAHRNRQTPATSAPPPAEPEPLPGQQIATQPQTIVPAGPDRAPGPQARPVGRRGSLWRTVVTGGVGAALGAAATLLAVQPGRSTDTAQPAAATAKPAYTCTYTRRAGLWYAGDSTTRTDRLVVDMSGPQVAELQCLLQRAGITPGGIDGNFGPLTEAAVIQAQKTYHLDVDGQVGPKTWAALRG
ncbi:MAG: helix-turn-helix domain-containing protein [Streptomyces sp.]|nr:helix-turn-helix domain-containing protein [Streptomyces sp.]